MPLFRRASIARRVWDYLIGDRVPSSPNRRKNRLNMELMEDRIVLNDAPIASGDYEYWARSGVLNESEYSVLDNDYDPDGPSSLIAVLDSDVSHGVLNLNSDGSFTYLADMQWWNPITHQVSDIFTYRA